MSKSLIFFLVWRKPNRPTANSQQVTRVLLLSSQKKENRLAKQPNILPLLLMIPQIGRVLLVWMIITTTITLLTAGYELEESIGPLLEKLVSINVPRVFAGSTDQE